MWVCADGSTFSTFRLRSEPKTPDRASEKNFSDPQSPERNEHQSFGAPEPETAKA